MFNIKWILNLNLTGFLIWSSAQRAHLLATVSLPMACNFITCLKNWVGSATAGRLKAHREFLLRTESNRYSRLLRCSYTAQFSRQLVSQRRCNESCRKNHSPVTLCNFLQQLQTFWAEVSWEPESRWQYQKMRMLWQRTWLENCSKSCWRGETLCNQCIVKSRLEFYFVQCSVQQKELQDDPCYTVQFTSNLCHKWYCEASCWENCAV